MSAMFLQRMAQRKRSLNRVPETFHEGNSAPKRLAEQGLRSSPASTRHSVLCKHLLRPGYVQGAALWLRRYRDGGASPCLREVMVEVRATCCWTAPTPLWGQI